MVRDRSISRTALWVHDRDQRIHPVYDGDLKLLFQHISALDTCRLPLTTEVYWEPGVKPGAGETPTLLLPTRSPFPARTLSDLPPKNCSPRYVIWTPSPTSPSFDGNLFLPDGFSLDISVTEVQFFSAKNTTIHWMDDTIWMEWEMSATVERDFFTYKAILPVISFTLRTNGIYTTYYF